MAFCVDPLNVDKIKLHTLIALHILVVVYVPSIRKALQNGVIEHLSEHGQDDDQNTSTREIC